MLRRLVRKLPPSVWALWALQTLLTARLLGHPRTVVEGVPAFLGAVILGYVALAVYGSLTTLLLQNHRILRITANTLLVGLFAALGLFRWHSGGYLDWGVISGFRNDLFDPQVRGMVSSFMGVRSYGFLAAATLGALWLEVIGSKEAGAQKRRMPWGKLALLVAVAVFLNFGPLLPEDGLTRSARSIRAYVELQRRMLAVGHMAQYPYVRPKGTAATSPPPAERPNVFFVVVESFNANFAESRTFDGREYTPFYNSLIPQGVYVENFHGNSVETARGHVALLLSIFPSMRGTMLEFYRGKHLHSLAQILKDEGYETIFYQAARSIDFQDTGTFMLDNGFSVSRAAGEEEGMDRTDGRAWGFGVQDDVMYEEFFSYLDEQERLGVGSGGQRRPYFGFLATISSHFPGNKVPPDKRFLFPSGTSERPAYANSIYVADVFLKTFMRELRARPYLKNSIVVITGDHSYPVFEHDYGNSEIGFYEENFRTPFLLLWDGHLAPRRIRGELWSQVDVAPTILDLLGIDVPNHFLGRSMLRGFDPARDRVALVQPYDGIYLAALQGNLKYVFHLATGEEYLYDLSRDPHEDNNIIARYLFSSELGSLQNEVGRIMLNQRLTEEDRIWPKEQVP